MKDRSKVLGNLPTKLFAAVAVVVFVVAGAVGLVLPFLPGLLFLAVAALIVARYFPSTRSYLRANRAIGRHVDRADGFLDLRFTDKLKIGGLVCAKLCVDAVSWIRAAASKLPSFGSQRY